MCLGRDPALLLRQQILVAFLALPEARGVCVEKSSGLLILSQTLRIRKVPFRGGVPHGLLSPLSFPSHAELFFEDLSSCALWPGFFFFVFPLDRNISKVKTASLGMGLSGRRGRGLVVTPGVSSGAFLSPGPFRHQLVPGRVSFSKYLVPGSYWCPQD